MTVASNNYLPLLLAGSGSQTLFGFPWIILESADLIVRLLDANGNLTLLTEGIDYIVDPLGINTPGGGSITLAVAPATGETLILSRGVPNTQQLSLQTASDFYPHDLEIEYDRIILLAQQLQYLISACVHFPANILPSAFDPALPPGMVGLQGMLLATNAAGNGFALVTPPSSNPASLTVVSLTVAVNYDVAPGVDVVLDTVVGNTSYRVNLPAASAFLGRLIRVKIANGGGHSVFVFTLGGNIDGQSSFSLVASWQSKSFISDGANWFSF